MNNNLKHDISSPLDIHLQILKNSYLEKPQLLWVLKMLALDRYYVGNTDISRPLDEMFKVKPYKFNESETKDASLLNPYFLNPNELLILSQINFIEPISHDIYNFWQPASESVLFINIGTDDDLDYCGDEANFINFIDRIYPIPKCRCKGDYYRDNVKVDGKLTILLPTQITAGESEASRNGQWQHLEVSPDQLFTNPAMSQTFKGGLDALGLDPLDYQKIMIAIATSLNDKKDLDHKKARREQLRYRNVSVINEQLEQENYYSEDLKDNSTSCFTNICPIKAENKLIKLPSIKPIKKHGSHGIKWLNDYKSVRQTLSYLLSQTSGVAVTIDINNDNILLAPNTWVETISSLRIDNGKESAKRYVLNMKNTAEDFANVEDINTILNKQLSGAKVSKPELFKAIASLINERFSKKDPKINKHITYRISYPMIDEPV